MERELDRTKRPLQNGPSDANAKRGLDSAELAATSPALLALRNQRERLRELLTTAGVQLADAEQLVLDAIAELSYEEWLGMDKADAELVERIDRACARYAATPSKQSA